MLRFILCGMFFYSLATVTCGQVVINGDQQVNGDLTVQGNLTVNGSLIVNGQIITQPQIDAAFAEDASNIFVELWSLDQSHNGLSVTLRGSDGNWENPQAALGLDEQEVRTSPAEDRAPNPLLVVLDETKLSHATYLTVWELFDNYEAEDGIDEDDLGSNSVEDAEIDAFLTAAMSTEVMQHCLEHINSHQLKPEGGTYTEPQFLALLKHQWFELFENHYGPANPDCSGFEHVFLGDHDRDDIGGHHFWFKFLQDQEAGLADSLGHNYQGPAGEKYPWVATFRMQWEPEPGLKLNRPDQKGFFVGASPELMLAYGTLGLLIEKKTNQHPVINLDGGRFELTVHASTKPGSEDPDERRGDQIRSVFPTLKSLVSGSTPGTNISVAEGFTIAIGEHLQVVGFVVGAHNDQFGLKLADTTDAGTPFLAVKLPAVFRETFNAQRNPDVLNRKVVVHGRRENYTGVPGIRDVTHIEFVD